MWFKKAIVSASALSPVQEPMQGWQLVETTDPGHPRSRDLPLWRISAAIVGLLGLPLAAHATPARLLFVTADLTLANSTNIATYNTFVTNEAALNPALPSTVWTAIVSTASTSAVANIDSACDSACQALPIYLVNGTKVADNQAQLFNMAALTLIDIDQYGNDLSGSTPWQATGGYVWTGSTTSGGISSLPAGGSEVETGNATFLATGVYQSYIDAGVLRSPSSTSLPLYAISGEVTVPTPEPMSSALLLTGGVATGLVRRLRRKRCRADQTA